MQARRAVAHNDDDELSRYLQGDIDADLSNSFTEEDTPTTAALYVRIEFISMTLFSL